LAWLGAIAAVGLVLIVLDVIVERVGNRRNRKRSERGLPPIERSWKRRSIIGGGVVVSLVGIGVGFALLKSSGSGTPSKAEQQVNVIPSVVPNATTSSTSNTTSTTVAPGRPPAQVRVEVINSSGVANAAKTKSDALVALGYQNAGLANGPLRTGTVVECKTGFEKEAVTLAANVGGGATVAPFPTPAPTGSTNADCVVELGK
jgi:hypothetical protein